MPPGGLVRNAAVGDNKTYNRFEIGASYTRPISSWAWNIGLNYYYLTYPSAAVGREDNDYMLTTGVSKPLRDWVTWGLSAAYTSNASSQSDAYQYSKWTVLTTASFNTAF